MLGMMPDGTHVCGQLDIGKSWIKSISLSDGSPDTRH